MLEEFDESLTQEFMDDFEDSREVIQNTLITLEADHTDLEAAKSLFRRVHTLKGNLQMIGLGEVSDLVHKLEDVLDAVRKEKIAFNPLLSDLILLYLETIHDLCLEIFQLKDVSDQLKPLQQGTKKLTSDQLDDDTLIEVIKVFDPYYKTTKAAPVINTPTIDYSEEDLELFSNLANSMEQRIVGAPGKTQRIINMALAMNEIANYPVNKKQLKAAAICHDIGMAFLPLSLINKTERYNDLERQKLYSHPFHGAELLKGLEQWSEASLMVEQHHERADGNGYPNKLSKENICNGAKILAIADTFESMSHTRADREHRRTIIRIVAEINAMAGTQFDPDWVDIFNAYVRERYLKKK